MALVACAPAVTPPPPPVPPPRPPDAQPIPPPSPSPALSASEQAPPSSAALSSLAAQRITAAREYVKLQRQRFTRGGISSTELFDAERTLLQAQREANLPASDLVAAAQAYLDATLQAERQVEDRFAGGAATAAEAQLAHYRVAEARFWLEEAKLRAQ